MNWLKGILSDVISLMFSTPENEEVHGWGTIIGVLIFLAFVFFMLSQTTG